MYPAPLPLSDEIEELLTGYVLGTLVVQERLRVEKMLKQSPELLDKVQQLETVLGLIAYGSTAAQVPSALRSRILEAAQQSDVQPRPILVGRSRPALLIGLALGLAGFLGLFIYQNNQLQTQVAKLESEVKILKGHEHQAFALKGTTSAPASLGNVILDLSQARASIELQNLPGLSKGEIYQMWAIVAGKAVACGSVKPDQNGRVLVNIGVPVHEYLGHVTQLLITKESTLKPQTPSEIVVMKSIAS